jgi:hypothetical protein
MRPRFQRGHPLLLDGKTQSRAAGANAAGAATSRQGDRMRSAGAMGKAVVHGRARGRTLTRDVVGGSGVGTGSTFARTQACVERL